MTQRFWPGETIRVRVEFTRPDDGSPLGVTGVRVLARPPDGSAAVEATVTPVPGTINAFDADFGVQVSGAWAVRATCDGPTPAAVEDEFVVARSLVL